MGAIASLITSLMIVYSTVYAQIKENIKAPRHWPLCAENSLVTGEFPAQMASNAENVSTWWRHHDKFPTKASPGRQPLVGQIKNAIAELRNNTITNPIATLLVFNKETKLTPWAPIQYKDVVLPV